MRADPNVIDLTEAQVKTWMGGDHGWVLFASSQMWRGGRKRFWCSVNPTAKYKVELNGGEKRYGKLREAVAAYNEEVF